eukprot:1158329-Pelagomonas_calceolata.AAC.21
MSPACNPHRCKSPVLFAASQVLTHSSPSSIFNLPLSQWTFCPYNVPTMQLADPEVGGETAFPEGSKWANAEAGEKYSKEFSDCAKVSSFEGVER